MEKHTCEIKCGKCSILVITSSRIFSLKFNILENRKSNVKYEFCSYASCT